VIEVEVLQSYFYFNHILTAFNKLKIISENCNTSTSITYWRLQQIEEYLWYNLQLVEGGQYVIEVEVLQSWYNLHLLKVVSMWLK
jgi:hypothetical protein